MLCYVVSSTTETEVVEEGNDAVQSVDNLAEIKYFYMIQRVRVNSII